MRPSVILTIDVPALGSRNPARLTQAGAGSPLRVLVRNVGGVQLFISHELQNLTNVNSNGGTYQLPAGQSDVFVVAPSQSLFAASLGGGGKVSLAISEAVPLSEKFLES